jgi:hypothetical protein
MLSARAFELMAGCWRSRFGALIRCARFGVGGHRPQTVYSLAVTVGMTKQLGDVEMFALIISGLCHDLEHPVGVCRVHYDLTATS